MNCNLCISVKTVAKKKPYVTSWERMAREEGKIEGKIEGKLEGQVEALHGTITDVLALRFGGVPEKLAALVNHLSDPARLGAMRRQAVLCSSLDEFTEQLAMEE